jgi:hypothetical protein
MRLFRYFANYRNNILGNGRRPLVWGEVFRLAVAAIIGTG